MEQDCQELNITFWISGLLATRFDLMRDISDLQMAWDWTIQGTKTSTSILESFEYATELCKEFKLSGTMADLNSAVTLFREGIAELPQGSENYAVFINNFVSALLIRFKQGGQQSDLNEAISLHLELFLPPHPNQSSSPINLATALWTQFEQRGQQSDLDEPISLYRQALKLFLPSHPNQSYLLSNLGSALLARFGKGGQQSDLDEAISLHRQTLKLELHSIPFDPAP